MRILFLNKASPKHEGGAEIRTREVGKRLVSAGHEVVVLAARTRIQDSPFEILDGMKLYHKKILPDWLVRRFPFPHYLPQAAANLFLMFHLYFFLKREKFDLIREDISPFPPSFLLALVRFPAPQRIAVVHNLPGTLQGWLRFYGLIYGVTGFLFDRMLRVGRLKYDRIICAAKWLADDLDRSPKIARRVSYVPNGVDGDRFSRIKMRRAEAQAIHLLSVGRLVAMKGFRYLIEALSHLKRDYPDVKLTILGKGPLGESLVRLARELRVEDRLEIRPPVPYEGLPQVYRQSDFLVLPFLSEGLPMTLLEAMAAGLPIVATDIPGITGVLDAHSATLARSGDASDLADKLKWAFEHPDEIARKTETARQISNKYDWDIIAKQELDLSL